MLFILYIAEMYPFESFPLFLKWVSADIWYWRRAWSRDEPRKSSACKEQLPFHPRVPPWSFLSLSLSSTFSCTLVSYPSLTMHKWFLELLRFAEQILASLIYPSGGKLWAFTLLFSFCSSSFFLIFSFIYFGLLCLLMKWFSKCKPQGNSSCKVGL